MDRDTIIRMAREAGLWPTEEWSKEYGIPTPNEQWLPELERFAALVAEREREACAKLADDMTLPDWANEQIATAIRARGQE
jgi:hypothetical protein